MVDRRWLHPAAGTETGHGFVQVYQQFELLDVQATAQQGEIDKLHARLKASEAAIVDLQKRMTALENPPAANK